MLVFGIARAAPHVLLGEPGSGELVIGVVRVYEMSSGVWYGGRLGVDAAYRRMGNIGRLLIVKAVTTAHAGLTSFGSTKARHTSL